MTQADRWKKRACVTRYWKFKDKVKESELKIPQPCKIVFYIPMPKTWSKKKKAAKDGKPHLQRPDKDNLEKGLLDAIFEEDAHIWNTHTIKLWAYDGMIEITPL